MDTLSVELRSKRMALIRSKGNTSTELRMVALFRLHRIIGWRRGQKVFGRPDFVFWRQRIAVFVDGDFWHGHPTRGRMPKSNTQFWLAKIDANRRRDREVNKWLRAKGWKVVRVWESSLAANADVVAQRISKTIAGKSIHLRHTSH